MNMKSFYLSREAQAAGWSVDWDPDLLTLRFQGREIAAWSSSADVSYATLRSQIATEVEKHQLALLAGA